MKKSFWLTILLGLTAYLVLPLPGLSAPLSNRIDQKRSEIEKDKQKEGVLSTTIEGFSSRIGNLEGEISSTQKRLNQAQSELDRQKDELLRVRDRLEAARDRLARLRSELATARRLLAKRLVEIYKSDTPDALTVVLESDGFADLLTRADFMERVSHQDSKIMAIVADAKADATSTAKQLDTLEKRQAKVAAQIEEKRDEVSSIRVGLVDRRDRIQTARADKNRLLASSRDRRHALEDDVAALQKQQAKIQAKLAGYSGPVSAGPVKPGSGGLIWPVNGPITSPFCESRAWESCHPGIDIGVPSGTPIRAAAAGKVVLMQGTGSSGGYGNFTCVQHSGSLSTCYAHQSRFGTSMGAQVSQGQVIGYVGCTGRCFGDHLHFETRINGSVVNPMNYL